LKKKKIKIQQQTLKDQQEKEINLILKKALILLFLMIYKIGIGLKVWRPHEIIDWILNKY
jgi:hypothetical protein